MMPDLPQGIVPVVQTAFRADLSLDLDATLALVRDALDAGADGFLLPAMASEVGFLTAAERRDLLAAVARTVDGKVPLILGASAESPDECAAHVAPAAALGAAAVLVAVPASLYGRPAAVDDFFTAVAEQVPTALVIQDLQFNGPGLAVEHIAALRSRLSRLAGIKIETAPAGPKYSAVRQACGVGFWISGGWAVGQMIEALDRGVDAMIPESSMVRVYKAVERAYRRGRRSEAVALFRNLLPVLAFTNQELATSIAFFKRLLVRKRIFNTAGQRMPLLAWDDASESVAGELIEHYLAVERRVAGS